MSSSARFMIYKNLVSGTDPAADIYNPKGITSVVLVKPEPFRH